MWIDAEIEDEGAVIAMMWSKFTLETTIEAYQEFADFSVTQSDLLCSTIPELVPGPGNIPNVLNTACKVYTTTVHISHYIALVALRLG